MASHFHDLVPEQATGDELGLLMAMLDATTGKWRRELGKAGRDVLRWQPYQNGPSVGALLLHMSDAEAFWLHQVMGGRRIPREWSDVLMSRETNQYGVEWPRLPARALSWYFGLQDEIRQVSHDVVRGLGRADAAASRGRRSYTLRWTLHHLMAHEAYHGGQAVLLRLARPRLPSQG